MRNQNEIENKVINFAKADERVGAVLLNGSRANPNVIPDAYQDFDVVFIVKDLESFLVDRRWINALGEPVLQQLPDEMKLGKGAEDGNVSFGFLMIFEDLFQFRY